MTISMTVKMSTHWRIIYWDQMLFQDAIPQLNLIFVIITAFCLYYYQRVYFFKDGEKGQIGSILLASLVLKGEGDPRYKHSDSVMHVQCKKIQTVANSYVYLLQYFNLYLGKSLLTIQLKI